MNTFISYQNIANSFSLSGKTYHSAAIAQKQIAEKLFTLIEQSQIQPQKALEIGCGSGFLTHLTLNKFPNCEWTLNDLFLSDEVLDLSKGKETTTFFLTGNAEQIDFPTSLDLITSSSTIQWFQDIPNFLDKCAKSLKPGGQIAFSSFGVTNFNEIRSLTQTGLNYLNLEEWELILKQNFKEIKISEERIILHFPSAIDVLKHLKKTGVNAGNRRYKTRSQLYNFTKKYEKLFQTDKGVKLTYAPIYIQAIKR